MANLQRELQAYIKPYDRKILGQADVLPNLLPLAGKSLKIEDY